MKLNEAASLTVKREEYPKPVPTIEEQIRVKAQEISDLKQEKVLRPATKIEYVNLLAQLEAQKADLIAENDRIFADNVATRKAVDDKYAADLVAFISDPQNIAKAQRETEIDRLIQEKILLYALDGLIAVGAITESERVARAPKMSQK
jgi:hypothetical protein